MHDVNLANAGQGAGNPLPQGERFSVAAPAP